MKSKFIYVIFILFIFFLTCHVYAYNLYWDTSDSQVVQTKNIKGEDVKVLRVQMSAGASDQSISQWEENDQYSAGKDGWFKQTKSDKEACGGVGNYSSSYTTFHNLNVLSTNYNTTNPTDSRDYVKINYLSNAHIDGGKVVKENSTSTKTAYVDVRENRNPGDFNYYKILTASTYYKYKIDLNTRTNYFIREYTLFQLLAMAESLGLNITEENTIRMSTINCTSDDREFINKSYRETMDTTWKYYNTVNIKADWNRGNSWYVNTAGYKDNSWDNTYANNCTANEYDNIIKLPPIDEDPTVVYIRHKDENGNTLDVHADKRTLTDNTTLENLGKDGDYTEKYKIPRNTTLPVDYVGQYIQVGDTVYEFVQSYYGESTESKNKAIENLKDNGARGDHKLEAKDDGKEKYVVIEYEYKPVPIIEQEFPAKADTLLTLSGSITDGNNNILVESQESSTFCTTGDENEDKDVLYIPASEKVNLNIKSQKFFYKKITQKPYVVNKQLKWKLIVEMYVLKDNTMRAKNSGESATTFFGNSNNNVVNATSPYQLKDTESTTQLDDAKEYINKNLAKYVGSTNFKIGSITQLTAKSAGTKTAESGYLDVASTRYNGIRVVSGDSSYKKYVFTVTKDDKNLNTSNTVDNNSDITLDTNSTRINLYTPLVVKNVKIKAEGDTIINHSDSTDVTQIQKGSKFTINPADGSSFAYPGASAIDTSKYAKEYKLVFDFDVNDEPAGTVFTVPRGQIFEGTVTGDIFQQNNSFKIMGVTINEPTIQKYVSKTQQVFEEEMKSTAIDSLGQRTKINKASTTYQYKQYIDYGSIGQIGVSTTACGQNTYLNFDNITDLKEGSFYRVVYKKQTINIGRIYGFRVTDCSDINWKDVFRTSEDGSVNGITGTIYFSGNKVYDYLSNQMTNATDLNGKTYIIPLGAYKHTNKTYIQAPKLGYRISFDLKTSGFYNYQEEAASANRYIKITPSYYFIRKDGTGYTEDIKLYYKNSSGKYSELSSSNYSISFIPKDGYRHTYDDHPYVNDKGETVLYQFNTNIMSDKLCNIKVSEAFNLVSGNGGNNKGMMAIDNSNHDSVQVWFGEYKLPNSTIAVKQEDGKYNINNPLSDGYIGVKFDIQCIDKPLTGGTITLSYNQNNKSSTAPNTTQWDYDQYLGYTGLGREFSGDIPIQLEKGVWHINSQAEWDKIRGTVILYDADNRAANDFE